jgi:hypothetical protein
MLHVARHLKYRLHLGLLVKIPDLHIHLGKKGCYENNKEPMLAWASPPIFREAE